MPRSSISNQVARVKKKGYKREGHNQDEDQYDHEGKKQSDYRRMESYKALEEYFDSLKK